MIQRRSLIIAIIFLISILIILAYPKVYKWYLNKFKVIDVTTKIISTDQNDLLRVENRRPSAYSLDIHWQIYMYCEVCNNTVLALYPKYDEVVLCKQSFTCIYKSKYMRAYEYIDKTYQSTSIFWISNNHEFCASDRVGLTNISLRLYSGDEMLQTQFYPFVKYMIMSRNWDWFEGFADIAVKFGDTEGIDIVKRYAEGKFSDEEVRINNRDEIKKEYVIEYSKKLLNKEHIKYKRQ